MAACLPERTGLPEAAQERLRTSPRTSDLSVDELALLESLEVDPLGVVFGSSMYHVGWQRTRLLENRELDVLSQAMHTARDLAVQRLEAEAAELGADGVVGVRLVAQQNAWGPGLLEFLAVGTAVRARTTRLLPPSGRPFASNLSGQDFWKLRRYGYRPVGLAFGCCVYHVAHLGLAKWVQQVGRNAEMEAFTQATYSAREWAMQRMGAQAREAGGELVVGVALSEGSWNWDPNVIEFAALGTAVQREAERPELPVPQLVLGMQAGAGAAAALGQLRGVTPPSGEPGRP